MDAWCGNCQPNQPIDNIRNASQLYGTELFISTNGFILTDIFPSHLRWYVLRAWYDHCDKLLLILTLFLCINQANITKIDVLASLALKMARERERARDQCLYIYIYITVWKVWAATSLQGLIVPDDWIKMPWLIFGIEFTPKKFRIQILFGHYFVNNGMLWVLIHRKVENYAIFAQNVNLPLKSTHHHHWMPNDNLHHL